MNNKVTMSDIAKLCGVSIATVSYVLNNKENSRIPEETKQKVLQVANIYMYRSNPYAKSLATGETTHNILFFYGENDFSLYKADMLNFIDSLSSYLWPFKYNLIVAPKHQITKYSYVDAIIAYRIDKKTFKELGALNFIPVISVDCHIDDDLFFEINNSFKNIDRKESIYLSYPYPDKVISDLLASKGVYFIQDFDTLNRLIRENLGKEIFCLNPSLCSYLKSSGVQSTYIKLDTMDKYKAISDALDYAIHRTYRDSHKFVID